MNCIIFDCDGVLVDSEDLSNQVLIDIAASVGWQVDMDWVHAKWVGKSLQFIWDDIEANSGKALPTDIEEEFRRLSFAQFRAHLQPIEGIHELLDKLNLPICVASNGPMNKIELNLRLCKLYPYFEGCLFSAYQRKRWKPDPDLFLHAAKTMGFSPEDCIVVEDSLVGVQAAVAGGFKVYGYSKWDDAQHLEDAGATPFYSMKELESLLGLS
jgi:HAD superfamily hydrolase (TIGR01509 family)